MKCLGRAFEILHNRKGIIYLSMGSFIRTNASIDKTHLQQAPSSILRSNKPAVIILVDPLFNQNDPVYIDRLKEYTVKSSGTEVVDPAFPKVVFMKCGEFLQDNSNALQKFARLVQQNPNIQFYVGDFTLTQPCSPFNEYPNFYKKLTCLPNVWLSQSCTREDFINASYKCQIIPSPYIYTQTPSPPTTTMTKK
jgi:hypothetical protein